MTYNPSHLSSSLVIRLPRPAFIIRSIKNRARQKNTLPELSLSNVISAMYVSLSGPVKRLEGGARNELWTLPTPFGKKVLKRYKLSQSLNQIQYEHAIFHHLEQKGFPTTRLVPNSRGETILQVDNRLYALFDFLEGYFHFNSFLYIPSKQGWFLTQMGRSLAILHQDLKDFSASNDSSYGFMGNSQTRVRDVDWYLGMLDQSRKAMIPETADFIHRELLDMAKEIEERLQQTHRQLLAANLARHIIHGDYGPHNLMVKPNAPICVLDFELARRDWRLNDLVSAFSSSTVNDQPHLYLPKISQIVAGYQSVNPLPKEELALLPLVWELKLLKKIIDGWGLYLETCEPKWSKELWKRIHQLRWLDHHRDHFAILLA